MWPFIAIAGLLCFAYLFNGYLGTMRIRREANQLAQDKYFECSWAFINSERDPDNIELLILRDRAWISHQRIMDFADTHIYRAKDLEEIHQWEFAKAYKQIAYADARHDQTPLDLSKVFPKK